MQARIYSLAASCHLLPSRHTEPSSCGGMAPRPTRQFSKSWTKTRHFHVSGRLCGRPLESITSCRGLAVWPVWCGGMLPMGPALALVGHPPSVASRDSPELAPLRRVLAVCRPPTPGKTKTVADSTAHLPPVVPVVMFPQLALSRLLPPPLLPQPSLIL